VITEAIQDSIAGRIKDSVTIPTPYWTWIHGSKVVR